MLIDSPGIQAESLMKQGALLPDSTILRLIISELTARGWLKSPSPPKAYTVNTVATSMNPLDAFARAPEEDTDNYTTSASASDMGYGYSDHPDASFILDGFPRTAGQAESLAALLPINLVVNIKTPVEVILDRICNRWVHTASGRVYNTTFNAPKVEGKDDLTGETLVQRPDDKPEVWKSRLAKFEETSLPLLEHYDEKGVLWTVKGNTSDEISPQLFEEFTKRFGREGSSTSRG